jgi:hypothetical protein
VCRIPVPRCRTNALANDRRIENTFLYCSNPREEIDVARDWEATFAYWASPPGKTEEERSENAVKAIRNAISASTRLQYRNIRVFVQGSYQNNVNVRHDSDVDVAILCTDVFFYDLPEGKSQVDFGITNASYEYSQFKDEVGAALANHFGANAVQRGNKAFDVRHNSYRVDADVAPFFEHRRYRLSGNPLSGVELRPDAGGRVVNWPEQHYANGVTKNTATGRRYKGVVRILKRLAIEMEGQHITAAQGVPGFLIECMVWNVPNDRFGRGTWVRDVQGVISFLWDNTRNEERCSEWGEVSELKYLFRGSPSSKRETAFAFIDKAWDFIGGPSTL